MKKVIPYHKPYKFNEKELEYIQEGIDWVNYTGRFSNADHVVMLEKKMREYYNVDYAIATSSCSQALLLCLHFIRRNHNSLQLSAFTWRSIKTILDMLQFMGLFWNDINEHTWLQEDRFGCPSLYLHTFGSIGESNVSNAIYDGSHIMGAKFNTIGRATCISLAPTKLITAGEGGMILTNDKRLYYHVNQWRDLMSRMSEFNAIIGLQNLELLDEMLRWKKKCFLQYKEAIPGTFQEILNKSSYNTIGFLNTKKLGIPNHIEFRKYYQPINDPRPVTDRVSKEIICLPSWYDCPIDQIIKDIKERNNL